MITSCAHREDGDPIPCPSQCPAQDWPATMFRRTLFGHWRLRPQYLHLWAANWMELTRSPVCDRDACYSDDPAIANASRLEHGCIPDWNR